MPSLAATFRTSLARQMEGYKDRVAANVRRQRLRHGQEVMEVAYRIGVDKRTYERWEEAKTTPRLGNFQALADLWEVEISDLRPDLEAEADQLQRLEAKLDEALALLRRLAADEQADQARQLADEATAEARAQARPRRRKRRAASR